jgi:hypothetical protein
MSQARSQHLRVLSKRFGEASPVKTSAAPAPRADFGFAAVMFR